MGYRDQGYLTVLVIDDDADMRELVTRVVLDAGHQVINAGSAEAGLEQLPYHTFDVALLDHRLPGMEGLVLGEYLHRNNPNMCVALMTGDDDPRLQKVAEEAGLVLLAKPFDLGEIETVLERAVKREMARAEAQTPAAADPSAGGPVDLRTHWAALPEAFAAPTIPNRIEEMLQRRIREALEMIRFRGGFDERARTIAYAGIVSAQVLGLKLAKTRQGVTLAGWYDALMVEAGRPPAFGDDAPTED